VCVYDVSTLISSDILEIITAALLLVFQSLLLSTGKGL
jgi:hypothetical protein